MRDTGPEEDPRDGVGPGGGPPEEPQGTVAPTRPGPIVGSALVGLVLGWAVRPVSFRLGYAEPQVSLATAALLAFVAAIIGWAAYVTRRTVRAQRQDLPHHHAVNRLVLGKACALVGALVAGGYLGYALAQLGVDDPMASSRLWRSLAAGVAGIAVTAAALLLEHACRVPRERR